MRRPSGGLIALVAVGSLVVPTGAAEQGDRVADYIGARLAVMQQIGLATAEAEALAPSADSPTPEMLALGEAIATDLSAFALLFPGSTNLNGGASAPEGVSTTAAAAIWENFDDFYARAQASVSDARAMANATDAQAYAAALSSLRTSCTSCHETYVFYDPFAAVN